MLGTSRHFILPINNTNENPGGFAGVLDLSRDLNSLSYGIKANAKTGPSPKFGPVSDLFG